MRRRVHVAGVALDAARALRWCATAAAHVVARRRARRRLLRPRRGQGDGPPGRGGLHVAGPRPRTTCPAVIEAHEARVPLIVLTADRPPELREVGAGQTIDQLKLYGDAVKWFFEVGTHAGDARARCAGCGALAFRASGPRVGGRPGPVHLNFPLREPLVLDGRCRRRAGRADGEPGWPRPCAGGRRRGADRPRPRRPRAVIVAGRHERGDGLGPALAAAAAALGAPLLADPLSGARRGPAAIAHYDALLRDARVRRRAAPRARRARRRPADVQAAAPWLAGLDAAPGRLRPRGRLAGPRRRRRRGPRRRPGARWARAATPGARRATALARRPGARADAAAAAAIARRSATALSEPAVRARARPRCRAGVTVFTASSMPVRDVETFWPARDDPPRVLAHRGANGIDGTLSPPRSGPRPRARAGRRCTSATSRSPTTSARCCPRAGWASPLTIVLVDNGGGGIFDFLPVAGQADAFEEHVATPDRPRRRARRRAVRARATSASKAAGRARARRPATLLHVRTDRARTSPCTGASGPRVAARRGRRRVRRAALACGCRDPDDAAPRAGVDRRPGARSSKGIAPGDIVEVDKQGPALPRVVLELEQRESGRFQLDAAPARLAHQVPPARRCARSSTVWRRAGVALDARASRDDASARAGRPSRPRGPAAVTRPPGVGSGSSRRRPLPPRAPSCGAAQRSTAAPRPRPPRRRRERARQVPAADEVDRGRRRRRVTGDRAPAKARARPRARQRAGDRAQQRAGAEGEARAAAAAVARIERAIPAGDPSVSRRGRAAAPAA